MDKDKKVIIKWIDSRQIHGWVLEEDIDDTCCSIISCGFLVKETDEAYIVALSKGDKPLQWCIVDGQNKRRNEYEHTNDYLVYYSRSIHGVGVEN